jgi:hypothetical protein
MTDIAIIEPNEDVYDFKDVELIEKVYQQLQFFSNATTEDFRKTLFLLSMYRAMNEMIENYEFVLYEAKEEKLMLNEYDMSGAEGRGKRINATDLVSDVTANTVIMKEDCHSNYLVYKKIRNRILFATKNISDIHESLLVNLLFTGKTKYKYKDAQMYMTHDYRKDIPAIQATTFADKRRKVIASLANSLLLNGTLDFVIIRYGRGRNENGEMGLLNNDKYV